MNKLTNFLRYIDWLSEWSGKAICFMVLAMIGVILYEVVLRYVFGAPTSWAHEASTMLYGSYCILAGAFTQRFRAHVRSDAVHRLFPKRIRVGLDCFTGLLTIAF
jgi:TRAP-type mannitol/chloroaromatic compound transport system permease small subunit